MLQRSGAKQRATSSRGPNLARTGILHNAHTFLCRRDVSIQNGVGGKIRLASPVPIAMKSTVPKLINRRTFAVHQLTGSDDRAVIKPPETYVADPVIEVLRTRGIQK